MAGPRTTQSLSGALDGPVADAFRAQLPMLREYVRGAPEPEALSRLQAAMEQVLTQNLGLEPTTATAAAMLARTQPGATAAQPQVLVVLERCALLRALVVAELAPAVAPYLKAAGRGAMEGLAHQASSIVMLDAEAGARRAIPTLPPVHSQDVSLQAAVSPLFTPDRIG